MDGKNSYVEDMDLAIDRYSDSPCPGSLFAVLCGLFDGIKENYSLPCPSEMNLEDMNVKPMFLRTKAGKEHLVVVTQPVDDDFPTIVDIRLRALLGLIFDTEDCEGIVFNPGGAHEFYVPKDLLSYALSAGFSMAEETHEKEKKAAKSRRKVKFTDNNSVEICRPIEYSQFEVIEKRIRNLTDDPDDYVIVDLKKDKDDLLFVQTIRHDELWYVELAFDMRDFGKKHPLIIGAELELEETVDLFKRLCEYGMSPDDIRIVQDRFRDIGFDGVDDDE